MRLTIATLLLKLVLLLAGMLLLGTSLFAVPLGLDNDPGWGTGRMLLAAAGAACWIGLAGILFAGRLDRLWRIITGTALFRAPSRLAEWARRSLLGRTARRLSVALHAFPPAAWLDRSTARRAAFFSGLGAAICLFCYLWILTSGMLTRWTPYSAYFDKLASAFLAGQLSLLEQPPPALLALQNPYDYHNRQGIGYLWDASLYQGKYYYYWGPVPALLAAGVKEILPVTIEDQYLLAFFLSGVAVLSALLLARLRARFFPAAPASTLLLLALLSGLALPLTWLAWRPSVYETAIAGGQFFLLLGLYSLLERSAEQEGGARFFLAGLAWGAAVNCRLSLAPVVIFFTALTAWSIARGGLAHRPGPRREVVARPSVLHRMAWLALPLALSVAAMGWYNAARFGSPLETGHRYQLTGLALPADYSEVTSIAYLPPNLYSYLVRPPRVDRTQFPFFTLPFVKESDWPFFLRLPEHYYYSEPVAGLLLSVPALWLAALPLLGGMKRGWRWLHEDAQQESAALPREVSEQPAASTPCKMVWLAAWGGTACVFTPLLLFISSSERYLADVAPLAVLLAALGWWWGLRFFRGRAVARSWLTLAGTLLILASVAVGLLGSFNSGDRRLETNNPALYYAMMNFFQK